MRHLLLALPLLLVAAPATQAQVSVSIGINLPVYPEFQRVPGYPVYYAPNAPGNYFFYDGLYWVFQSDNWYSSDWYNGPWQQVGPDLVPLFVLRVPVRYYRQAPSYFGQWRADAPPRWGEHWGRDWEQRRSGWDRWDRQAMPAPAPLPSYQGRYPQSRYPQAFDQQRAIRSENYRYRPREPVTRELYQAPAAQRPQGVGPPERGHDMARPQPGERGRGPAQREGRRDERDNRQGDRDDRRPARDDDSRGTQ
ncbi:hypothetical protein [Hydrogenophaga sp. OTU3427]|uniref:hypothetical protein n=1 Tax=Hydrogenophaga sp. OTU3427 TaxID=3043856 RepID=UPI00313E12C4